MVDSDVIQRLLIVGHGSIGRRHLRIVRESLPAAEIMVLRHQVGSEVPALANYVTSVLTDAIVFSPDITIIASPAPYHLRIVRALLSTHCHFLIEKPLAVSSDGVDVFMEKLVTRDRVCQVGYNLRFLPSLAKFRELILAGSIGQPLAVRCEVGQYLPDWRPGSDYRLGVSARSELGGGVLLELSHEIDYLRWIFGDVAWVRAWLGHLSELEVDVEDCALLTMGWGPQQGKGLVASLNLDFFRLDTTRVCTVIGSEGTLRWDAAAGTINLLTADSREWIQVACLPHERDDSYRAQWKHFLNCVETGSAPLADFEAGVAVLKIIEGARTSAQNLGLQLELSADHATEA